MSRQYPEVRTTNAVIFAKKGKCKRGWKTYGNSCYKLFKGKQSYDGATAECEKLKAHLTRIEDKQENNFISKMKKRKAAWIGLHYEETDEDFHWFDCPERIHYSNWKKGEVNRKDGQNCAVMLRKGVWKPEKCGTKRRYVCEKTMKGPVTKRCNSLDFQPKECRTTSDIRDICLVKQFSESECAWDKTYNISESHESMHVYDGCRGKFDLYF
ncbi:hypothetical protein ScPMuIL_009909 [Solemya velum]